MASACSTAVLIASLVWGISDSSVIQEHGCKSTRVIDGDTGVLKFFLRNDINMSSDELFAYLRRASDLDTDIVQCFRKNKDLAVDCKSVNARYQTDGLINNIITLSIPNVTREFEDTYSLRVYVNSKAEPPISCSLEVIVPTTPDGGTGGTIDDVVLIAVVAGSLGTLIVIVVITVCCLRKIRRSKKKKAFASSIEKEQTFVLKPVPANKKRSKKAADALLPQTTPPTASDIKGTSPRTEANRTPEQDEFRRRKDGTSEVESIDNDNYKSTASPPVPEAKRNSWKQKDLACQQSKKAADALLPHTTPSTASDVIETSIPSIETNHSPEQDEFRRRKDGTSEVESIPSTETNHSPEQDEFRRRKDGTSEVESIDNDNNKSTASPPVPEAKRNSWKQKDLTCQQWYFRNTTSEQAEKWLLAAGNREGSFLVIDSNGKPDKYLLKVKFYGEVKNRFIFAGQSGFRIESNCHFPTVTDLIDHYCENAGCLPTKLSVPCSRVHTLDSLGIL